MKFHLCIEVAFVIDESSVFNRVDERDLRESFRAGKSDVDIGVPHWVGVDSTPTEVTSTTGFSQKRFVKVFISL